MNRESISIIRFCLEKRSEEMSLAKYAIEYEELQRQMRLFCITPAYELFIGIIANKKVRNLDEFGVWMQVAFDKYAQYWKTDFRDDFPPSDLKLMTTIQKETQKEDIEKLLTRARIQPRLITLKKLWACFYASGSLTYLQAAYEIGGDSSASEALRNTAVEIYDNVRRLYTDVLSKLPPTYFTEHFIARKALEMGSGNPLVSPNVFQQLDEVIKQRLSILEKAPLSADAESLLKELKVAAENVESSFSSSEEKEKEKKDGVKESDDDRTLRAERLFDKLASKLQ
jgi:hypothetical protein